ncbi:hypothetical protein [Acidovorax sp. LjRoot66]|uniref:hypothetical protein n=1 Tax=Acidovorax sp. LjRoot66 TaxID=3342334 RepID=UPI003F4FF636
MIKDASILWMELDSTRIITNGKSAPVDDIIVGWYDGRETCCQCKKNQGSFTAWSVDDLVDDLAKAADHLAADPNVKVRFYSRADFGDLGRLVDRAKQMPDLAAFDNQFPRNLSAELNKLKNVWSVVLNAGTHNVHDLLSRLDFEPTPSVDDLPEILKVDLGLVVTRVDDAFNALWSTLDILGSRTAPSSAVANPHRITRGDLLSLLENSGCAIAPPSAQADIEAKLARMSRIGRAWRRDIGQQRIARPVVDTLLGFAENNTKLLLTDGPGAGKTCVLLELSDRLEKRSDLSLLFLQAREFVDVSSQEGREALGLQADIPALVSAMSQWKRVIVVIDSLDVLSLNRESECLTFFLSLIDRVATIPNVCVIAACRSFDLRFNKRLASQIWDRTIEAESLDWDTVTSPLLDQLGIDTQSIDKTTRELLGNPRNLALFADIALKTSRRNAASAQELTEVYLDDVVASAAEMGSIAMVAIENMASEMLSKRRHQLPRSRITVDDVILGHLLSANVLFKSESNEIGFGHQTLLDALAVRKAIRQGVDLLELIQSLQPVPFIRPAIRAFFTHLRLRDPQSFRIQVRAVFEADVAFHIKRLIAESYALCDPEDADWNLLRHIFRNDHEHFRTLYFATTEISWHHFWICNFIPFLESERRSDWLEIHVGKISLWADKDPVGVFSFWTRFATSGHAINGNLRRLFSFSLRRFKDLNRVDAYKLLQALVNAPSESHYALGNSLLSWARHDSRGDKLLWQYVIADVPNPPNYTIQIDRALQCDGSSFDHLQDFTNRFADSELLLNLAIASLEQWSENLREGRGTTGPNRIFLEETSFGVNHSRHAHHHPTALNNLLEAVELAVLRHAKDNDEWWKINGLNICLNNCGGLRHIGMLAMTRNPEANIELTKEFFADDRRSEIADPFELGNLISASAPYIGETLDLVEDQILKRLESVSSIDQRYVDVVRYGLLCKIPAMLRSRTVQQLVDRMSMELAPPDHQPQIHSWSGGVGEPFRTEDFALLEDASLVRLLVSSQSLTRDFRGTFQFLEGAVAVDRLLRAVASAEPRRYTKILIYSWTDLPNSCRRAILGGVSDYLLFRYGDVKSASWRAKEEVSANELSELLMDELERHPSFWMNSCEGAAVIRSCASVSPENADVSRLLFLAIAQLKVEDPRVGERQDDDLVFTAINSDRGILADGLMSLTERLAEAGLEIPALIGPILMRLARDDHPAVRAVVIRRLAYIHSKTELGWPLFDAAFSDDDERVWAHANDFLYYVTVSQFARSKPYLDRMEGSTVPEVLKAWGRLSALSVLGERMPRELLEQKLKSLASEPAWKGATTVWIANARNPQHASTCFAALEFTATQPSARQALLSRLGRLFEPTRPIAKVPLSLFRAAYGEMSEISAAEANMPHQLDQWLCSLAEIDPDSALDFAEIAANLCKAIDRSMFYDVSHLGTLLTSLFREAEERESYDGQAMLRRVVKIQDIFLSLPMSSLGEWLHAAERPEA